MQANPSQSESSNRLLHTLLRLEKRLRQCESAEALRFIAVNDSLGLVGYEQGAMGSAATGVSLLSGLSEPDLNAPYVGWLKKLFKFLGHSSELRFITAQDLPAKLNSQWQEWMPAYLAALPVAGEWLLLARQTPFSDAEKKLLNEWSSLVDYHLKVKKNRTIRLPRGLSLLRSPLLWLILVVGLSLVTPVKLSVLAPAEVRAKNPALIRAPLDGVIAEVLVEPDQFVEAGALLLRFDDRTLRNQLDVAQQRIQTAQAAYRQTAQQALVDAVAQTRLVLLQSDIEEARLEVEHLQQLLERTDVRAPLSGQVLMPSQQQWLGRPVSLGESILQLANPDNLEVKAWLSPRDQVPLEEGSALTLFDNSRPDSELQGALISVGFQVEELPDGSFAFPVRGELFSTGYLPPIGSRGTVKLESGEVSLAYLIVRRPLAIMRQWLGV